MSAQKEALDTSCQVFVGKLPQSASEDDLVQYFSSYGTVDKVVIKRDTWTNESRGFGYVTFSCSAEAEGALAIEDHTVNGQKIGLRKAEDRRVTPGEGPAQDPKRLWVGSLPDEASEDDIKTYFGQFGAVVKVELKTDENGKSKGFAFISFEDETTAKTAMEFEPHRLGNKDIEVKKPNAKRSEKGKGKGKGMANMWGGKGQAPMMGMGMGMGPMMGGMGGMGWGMGGMGMGMGMGGMGMMAMKGKGMGKGKGMMGKGMGRYSPY